MTMYLCIADRDTYHNEAIPPNWQTSNYHDCAMPSPPDPPAGFPGPGLIVAGVLVGIVALGVLAYIMTIVVNHRTKVGIARAEALKGKLHKQVQEALTEAGKFTTAAKCNRDYIAGQVLEINQRINDELLVRAPLPLIRGSTSATD